MSTTRLLTRWVLTLAALSLALVAMLLVLVRLGLAGVELTKPRLETLLSARFDAVVAISELQADLRRFDPELGVTELVIHSRGADTLPLLEVEHGRLRLDTLATLRDGLPVVEDARLQGITVHLYQDRYGSWRWPDPADIPPELVPDVAFDLARLDFWVGLLLRQRAWAEDVRLVLHGQTREVELEAPRLLMTGDDRRAHLEGEVYLAGEREVAMQVVLDIQPGQTGLRDFGAALQADMRLASLLELAEVLGHGAPLRLETARGEARLWGRWHQGEMADARLDLKVPRLGMSHEGRGGERRTLVLEDVEARAQWLRRDQGWEAWLEGDAESADRGAPSELGETQGPALPRRWHATGEGDDWWLNTSGFDLEALAAWRERLPLPEALDRALTSLEPRGWAEGLRLGYRQGHWIGRAALHDVEVAPWQHIPGGGPMDMWVEARDFAGRVRVAAGDESTLRFPRVFPDPLNLDHARGDVRWAYDGRRIDVSGRDIHLGWQDAQVNGDFDLSLGGEERGGLDLNLAFSDVDALGVPLRDWLPLGILSDPLIDFLTPGVGGHVPSGHLRLHLPLVGDGERIAPTYELALAIEQGHLAFAPGWPALEEVEGRLTLDEHGLEGRLERATSRGASARDGQVSLEGKHLTASAELAADMSALRRYLLAMPVPGIDAVADWQGEGRSTARLGLVLPLGQPGALELDIDGEVEGGRLDYRPLGLAFRDLSGSLAWRQRGRQGALQGEIAGRLLGGPVRAEVDTAAGRLDLAGTAEASAIADWAGAPILTEWAEGRFDWQGRQAIGEGTSNLRLDSDLRGLAIALPEPLGKTASQRLPLHLTVNLADGRLDGRLGDQLQLRWRALAGEPHGQGQVWLGHPPGEDWPRGNGWWVDAYRPRLDLAAWGEMLAAWQRQGTRGGAVADAGLKAVSVGTECLWLEGRCLGTLQADGQVQTGGGWHVTLGGDLLAGELDYRPRSAPSVDVALERLRLGALMPAASTAGTSLLEEVAPPSPASLPTWLDALPDGRLRIDTIGYRGEQFGPFTARWRAELERLTLAPLEMTLGEITADGELIWEAVGANESLTRARLGLSGGDLGTALARLDQPVAIRNSGTQVESQLAWPGAPWQFALERSRGSIEAVLSDGRFVNLESPSARVVGLLNFDNLLRRLRLDFSDVTGRGTAFDRVTGAATLYGGILETREPVRVEGPATLFTLTGSVDLGRRQLDQRLSVTVPVSRNLPLAAVIAGAPVVGGALFIADKLFGDAIDRVTRIHYRVRGPWTSPRIAVESAE